MYAYLRFFQYAFSGIKYTFFYHKSFRIQLFFAGIGVLLGLFFGITSTDWILLIVTSGMVLTAELFNTASESILDYLEKKHNLRVRIAKDVAAGGVLVTAIVSILVGGIIFAPYLLRIISKY